MNNLKELSRKEKKILLKKIEGQYGISSLKINYIFLKNNENKIFVINKNLKNVNLENIRINSIGLYFCRLENELRLTIEGSQIIGPFAKKNVIDISEDQSSEWLAGNDLENIKEHYDETFVIIRNKKDFIGTGKYKDGKILNYVPKERRIK
ncbi:hypothetical protein J4214_01860 [Candidatus Woesearchaeota archaeon]|nr:hypothetical protein [Candidatus Woesearchaeota archaeon]